MAVTLLRKPNEEGEIQNLFFKTENIYVPIGDHDDTELHTYLIVSLVDDELKPLDAEPAHYEIGDEETFHRNLRKESAIHGHLITSHSTNPEWNPENYEKHLEENEKISDNN